MKVEQSTVGRSLAATAVILFLAAPAIAQVSISTDDGLGVSVDAGDIGVDANVSTNDGLGVDADASVGSGVDATADVGVGGSSGVAADVDASIGGPSGVTASADVETGGSPGVDADVTASIGGDGSNGGIEGDATGTLGDLLGLDVDLGIGGSPGGVAEVPAEDDANNGPGIIGGFFTGPGNDGRNDRVASAIADMSPAQMEQYRRQCRSIMADPGGFDRDLVSMCRALSR